MTETPERRVFYPLVVLGFCFLAVHLINNLLPLIHIQQWHFAFPGIIPTYDPVGMDFRRGLYVPAQMLLRDFNVYPNPKNFLNMYPPLVSILGVPYLLLDENTAYIVHVVLLVVANAFCLFQAGLLVRDYSGAESGPRTSAMSTLLQPALWILVFFNLVSSYPFLFSIERGNTDIFAMVFALGSIWMLLKHPTRVWLQVVLLSLAVHIKAYPIMLFALLFFVHRSRIILPSVLTNLLLLLILGPANAVRFVENLLGFYNPVVWVGNHSGYSFATLLAQDLPAVSPSLPALQIVFSLMPLVIWMLAWVALLRFRSPAQAVLPGLMVTMPLMITLPSLSNDYNLVILWIGILILLSNLLFRMATHPGSSDYLQMLVISILTLLIGRAYALMGFAPNIVQNKYLWIILLQLLMLASIYQQLRASNTSAVAEIDARQSTIAN